MARTILLIVILAALVIYAWRDWFVPVCVLVVMDAVMKHDDMPRSMFGVPGLNPWNFILAVSAASWLMKRITGQTRPDTPPNIARIFLLFCAVVLVAYVRGVADCRSIPVVEGTVGLNTILGFTIDYLINPVKYLLTAFLLYDGARTRRNMLLGFAAILGQSSLYAARVIQHVPPSVLLMSENPYRYRISRECGLHANDMALVMVVGFWSMAACAVLWRHVRWWWRLAGIGGMAATFISLGLTLSRGGFLAFVGSGFVFGLLRWRPLLVILPVSLLITAFTFPSVTARIEEGIGIKSIQGDTIVDPDAISSGRLTDLWPPTLEKIAEGPLCGFGRLTILRTDLYIKLLHIGTVPQHPHNAYLEMLADAGIIGLAATLALYVGFPVMALRRVRPTDPVLNAAIGVGVMAASAMLLMSLTGQTFFPREGIFIVLCCYALMMRAYVIQGHIQSLQPATVGTIRPQKRPVVRLPRRPAPRPGLRPPRSPQEAPAGLHASQHGMEARP